MKWTTRWENGIEVFVAPTGEEFVRALPDEEPEFRQWPKNTLPEIRLVRRANSGKVKRIERKMRKQARELRKRGYEA